MSTLTVRNLPEATHRALKLRAARSGRSTEAEVREILSLAVTPPDRVRMGSALAAFGRRFGGLNLLASRRGVALSFADATIAAIATRHEMAIATRDEDAFRAAGLQVINPWASIL